MKISPMRHVADTPVAPSKAISTLRGITSSLLCTALLAGCGALTRTAYVRPPVDVPAQWHAANEAARLPAQPDQDAWWRAFNDPALDALIERALARNQDLATAVINLHRARDEVELTRAGSLPNLTAGAQYSGFRNLTGTPLTSRTDTLNVSVSYEVDLWGSLASATDAARWEAHATEQDRHAVEIAVAASVASAYWQLALLADQIEQSTQSIRYEEQTTRIAMERYRTGAISAADRLAAEQVLATERASQSTLQIQMVQGSNALSLLLGEAPGEVFNVSPERLAQPVPSVQAGIPADILARRPDVQAAEMRVREALDQLDSTRTSFYPTLSLTGSAGTTSDALRNLLQNPVGTLAASLGAPFLNVWTMKPTVGIARASYDAAVVAFQKTFYQALSDVGNALAAREYDDAQIAQTEIAADLARQAERRYAWQYAAGLIPLQTLLDAQQRSRDAHAQVASARYNGLANQAALYQALGGTQDAERNVPQPSSTDPATPNQDRT
jgi:NodT family efflux transporter outer membrane factor (OMF) lipoprotein